MRLKRALPDRGFTMVELAVTMTLFGIIAATAVWGWVGYTRAQEQVGTATSVLETLRNAHERAQSENATYCVRFTAGSTSWSMYRTACGSGTLVNTWKTNGSSVKVATATFTAPGTSATSSDVIFLSRGLSSAGELTITRTGKSKVYTINVVGLTSRVCLAGVDAQCDS